MTSSPENRTLDPLPVEPIAAAMRRLLQLAGSCAQSRFVTVAGAPLHYLEQGSGPAVVLLHGGTGGGANWFRLLEPLARNYRVLAPDLPGFGLSPAREPTAPIAAQAAALFDEWLARLDVRAEVIAGTSFGGIVALRLAQRAPDRVARLFLLDAAGLARGHHVALRMATLPLLRSWIMRPTRVGTVRMFRRLLTSNRTELSAEIQDALIEWLYLTAAHAGTPYLVRTLRLFGGLAGQREFLTTPELAALPQRTTIAIGEHDRFFSASAARAAADAMPRGEFLLLHNAGHSPNWETPAPVLRAILSLLAR